MNTPGPEKSAIGCAEVAKKRLAQQGAEISTFFGFCTLMIYELLYGLLKRGNGLKQDKSNPKLRIVNLAFLKCKFSP